jgi:hypothetical protein
LQRFFDEFKTVKVVTSKEKKEIKYNDRCGNAKIAERECDENLDADPIPS